MALLLENRKAKSVSVLFDEKDNADVKYQQIYGQDIKLSRSIKYLGIIIDSKLKLS